MSAFALLFVLSATAADPAVPTRQIPPSVLVELQLIQNRFELALASDCAADQCYSNGCSYLDHAVSDQARARSMPGLGLDAGPGSTETQAWLTRAQCTFSHESSVDAADAAAIVRRLQSRMTTGWTVVSVDHVALPPIPSTVEEPAPEVVEPVAPVEPPEPTWTLASAWQELWTTLLPDAWWMVGVVLITLAGVLWIWALRRVGRASFEEQALLAQLNQPAEVTVTEDTTEPAPTTEDADAEYVAKQEQIWQARLSEEGEDPALTALIRQRLRAGDLSLLARAVLHFPAFLTAFPQDGETATTKLDLAELLQGADAASLPADAAFFRALERHALAASLASQTDASIVRSLREDFGSAGLVALIGSLPARMGALLFAMAPASEQLESVRLLSERQVEQLSQQLLRSNRMDPSEVAGLMEVLRDAGQPIALPDEITDRGTTFDAAGALAALLPRLSLGRRAALFDEALARFQGSLPLWHREIFVPDMLFALDTEARADLLLAIEIDPLAAWFSQIDPGLAGRLLDGTPDSLRTSIRAVQPASSRGAQLALAAGGRRMLARGFQRQLARIGLPFERVVRLGGEET